jgi:menaquinone-9 beta-reductase
MHDIKIRYDVILIGGGLAGLSLSILLAKQGLLVAVIEKKKYPLHRVCGEYVSLESWSFLERLGVELSSFDLPIITNLQMTAIPNYSVETKLPLGGFGISRYLLDNELVKIAKQIGVDIYENTTFYGYTGSPNFYHLKTSNYDFGCKLIIGSFGKFNIQQFNTEKPTRENYIGVKYHLQTDFAKDKIALHNFEGGYAGISAIENNKYCFCYMVKANVLKQFSGIDEMNELHLAKNYFLKDILRNSDFLWEKPVTISNIYFGRKGIDNKSIFNIGDCAGAIPPLAGNGMSLALRTAHLVAPILGNYFNNKIDLDTALQIYQKVWHQHFNARLKKGKLLQILFAKKQGSKIALQFFNALKPIQSLIIKQTHGESF